MHQWRHTALSPADPLVTHFGWWFFLMATPRRSLGPLLWQAESRGMTLTTLTGDVILPAVPDDLYWLRHPWTPDTWFAACQASPLPPREPLQSEIAVATVWMTWRVSFWHQWRLRAAKTPGTVQPIYGPRPRIRASESGQHWLRRTLWPQFSTHCSSSEG
jgi:hypothetical protein